MKPAKLPPQSEDGLLRNVLEYAKLRAWRTFHVRAARVKNKDGSDGWRTPVQGDGKDFPDLLMLRGTRQVVAELKAEGKRPTPGQTDWLLAFGGVGAECFVWRPHSWEEIMEVLE